MSNCHLVAARSLIDLAASRLALRAPALRAEQLGWFAGRNVRIDYRWCLGNAGNIRKYAEELAALVASQVSPVLVSRQPKGEKEELK
jgi:hypothetical protein